LYLWHWPILVIATQYRGVTTLPVWDNVLLLLVATLVAALTYRLLENPVRHSKFLARRRWASIIVGIGLVGITLVVTTHEQQWPTVDLGNLASATTGSTCQSAPPSEVSRLRSSYTSGHPATQTSVLQDQSVLVIGDSTSCTLLAGLKAVGPSFGMQFGDGTVVGCGIVSGEAAPVYGTDGGNFAASTSTCQGRANRVESVAIERDHPSLIVWGSTAERGSVLSDDRSGTKQLVAGSPEWRSAMLHRINQRVDQLLSTGARVVFLLEPPPPHPGSQPNSNDIDYARLNALLRDVAVRHPHHVTDVNLFARVCPSGPPCPFVPDGFHSAVGPTNLATVRGLLRPDTLHYSPGGSLWVARWLVPQIDAAAKSLSS
jgi:hypothetical protein